MRNVADLLREAKGDVKKESIELNIEELKTALSKVDSQMKNLPATAQVHVVFICIWLSLFFLIIFLCGMSLSAI